MRTRLARRTKTLPNGAKVVTTKLVEAPELEWVLQSAAVRRLRSRPEYGTRFTLAGDYNAGRRSHQEATKAKATGLTAGEHDLRIYMEGGRLGLIEMKGARGRLSPEQVDRHALLLGLGFADQAVVKAKTEKEAADLVEITVLMWLAANDNGKEA